VRSLNKEISDMDKPWDSMNIVNVIKKDTEIVAQIRNNGAAIAAGNKAFDAIVDKIKSYKPPTPMKPKPDPKEIARLTKKVAEATQALKKAKGKK
jgi:hypothetical protein